ncbi:MAG: carboxypeptidase-like regulatory domain-containing protein [Flavobacteriales bacterium]|nr:carboxypeptidase-like regulatory domain-containing protein [Flavobacteriales bacterium]
MPDNDLDVYKQSSAEEASIRGIVSAMLTDGTETILAEVLVTDTVSDIIALTDERGQYLLPLLPEGNRQIRFSKERFVPQYHTVDITVGQVTVLDITLLEIASGHLSNT